MSETEWSLRITLDDVTKKKLDQLRALLSHKVPNGDLAAVLGEAIDCAIDKHGRRKGAVAPAKPRRSAEPKSPAPASSDSRHIPAEVRRQVWERDGGRCAWTAPDGTRCGSTWMLEIDHITPVALGGRPTLENSMLACRPHNLRNAEQVFGREHMDQFRREVASRSGESAISGDSHDP